MLRQQIANLFYEILTSFPRELTQLLAEYIDILPTKYTLISNAWPEGFFPTGFEVIPNKGLVIYNSLNTGYQKINFQTFKKEYVQNNDGILCTVNKSGDDFIFYHQRSGPFNQKIHHLIDDTYLLAYDGVCKYSLTTPELEMVIPGNVMTVDKVREGFIVYQTYMNDYGIITENIFMYDQHMANPVKLTTPYDRISGIFETSKHLYITDYEGDVYIDNKRVDVPDYVNILGIYQDHIIGSKCTDMGESEKLIMLDGSDWRVLYTDVSSAIWNIKCFENEIYVLTKKCLYKLSDEMVG